MSEIYYIACSYGCRMREIHYFPNRTQFCSINNRMGYMNYIGGYCAYIRPIG